MIGIDIVENSRIAQAYNKFGENFLKKIYTPIEREYCFSQKYPIPCLAARWAAKEAVIKAFFQCFNIRLNFKQIEIRGFKGYPPKVIILGKEKELLEKIGKKIIVSLAHEKNYSVAIAQII